MEFANYGQTRDVNCTEAEAEIFHIIRSRCDDVNLDSRVLKLVRKSDSYVSAVMESSGDYGLLDVARFKYTDRAKWIKFAPGFEKIPLHYIEDVARMIDEISAAYQYNVPFL